MFLLGGKNCRGPKNFTTNCSFQNILFFFSVIGNDFLFLYFLPIFFHGALSKHKFNSKTMFLLGVKNWRGPKNFTTNCSFQIILFPSSCYWNKILYFYNFCQFSSGALLLDIRLIQKQSFYLVEKIREAKKVLQQIVHSKLFHSFSLLLEMIFFYYIFCQFSSRALLVNISLIQKQSFYLVKKIGEAQKISQQIVHSTLFYYLPPVIGT